VGAPLRAARAFSGRIVIAIVVCALVMGAAIFRVNGYINDEIDKIPRISLTTAAASSTGTNFLIIGSDTRSFVQSEQDKEAFTDKDTTADGPARSDTMMVLHADGDNSYVVSFPRDLMVNVPTLGRQKINAAFNKGPQLVIDTLQQDFQVPIQHYLEVNFKTFEDIVNAVGSVPVYFPYPARDQYSGLGPTLVAGCYHLDGAPALAYVRSRHLEYLIDGKWKDASGLADIDRIQRQQDFIRKLGTIAVQSTTDDPSIAPDLANDMIPHLTADTTFDRSAFNLLVRSFMGLADGKGGGPIFETLPWKQGDSAGSYLLEKEPEADAVLAVLRGTAPIPTTTTAPATDSGSGGSVTTGGTSAPAVRAGDVSVKVLNASGVQGAAGTTSEQLSQKGYVQGGLGNDPRGRIDHTEIRYASADAAKAQLLATVVPGAQLVADSTLSSGTVVLVLGTDFKGLGSGTTATTAAPATAATTTTLSPEAACV
jgi:LCP family protein required for cell wall assembly